MRRLIQTETGVRALWKLTSAGRRLQFHNGIRELIGQFPTGSYLLRTVHPEGLTASKNLPLFLSNQPDSDEREDGQKTRLACHQFDGTCRIVARRVNFGLAIRICDLISNIMKSFVLRPWQFLFIGMAGWINRSQQDEIEYLRTENKVLREVVGKKRILLNDDQRRRLAVKGKILGLSRLRALSDIFTPETILRWHRQLVARKWDHSDKRKPAVGRTAVDQQIVDLVLKFARENPTWGYDRIQGALANVGHKVSDQTVGNILKLNGIETAPDRKRQTTWETFLKAHWDSVAAIDFTTTEIWTLRGLVTTFILVVMNLKTRRIEIVGVTAHPDSAWVRQMGRNLTDAQDGFLLNHSHILIDRDTKFSPFRDFLKMNTEIDPVLLPPRSPNCNAHIERFMLSLKTECVDRMIFFGEAPLRKALAEFESHYHEERNHQGLENLLIDPGDDVGNTTGNIECRERLGGLLRYYHRRAA